MPRFLRQQPDEQLFETAEQLIHTAWDISIEPTVSFASQTNGASSGLQVSVRSWVKHDAHADTKNEKNEDASRII
jgi:hypothetical protein